MKKRPKRPFRTVVLAALVVSALFLFRFWRYLRDPSLVLVTGYCNCGECCGWEFDEKSGKPVYAYGKFKGKPKKVGITASGTTARHGTVAADLSVFSFGTCLEIPGYGIGRVEDVGGAIRRRHIDVWFPTHEEARRWGRRRLKVVPISRSERNSH